MSLIWLDSDVRTLERLADLVDVANRGEATAALLSEIRQLEDRFGLSPISRRRLQWEIGAATAAATPPVSDASADDARFLRLLRD